VTLRVARADLELFERVCRRPVGCGGRIMWARTNASNRTEWMPLDAEPADDGNVLAYPAPDNARLLVCDVLGHRSRAALDAMRDDGVLLFRHHRLSCPRADSWARQPLSMRPGPTGVRPAPKPEPEPEPEGLFDLG
jgi:hypothetical protein